MNEKKILYSLTALLNGNDPCTAALLDSDSIYQDPLFLTHILNATERINVLLNNDTDLSRDNEEWDNEEIKVLATAFLNGATIDKLSKRHLRSIEKISHKLSESHIFDQTNDIACLNYNRGIFRRTGLPWTELEYRLVNEIYEAGFNKTELCFMLIRDKCDIPDHSFEFSLNAIAKAYRSGDYFAAKDGALKDIRHFGSMQDRFNFYPCHQRILNILINLIILTSDKDELYEVYIIMNNHLSYEAGIDKALESDFFALALKLLYGSILKGNKDGEAHLSHLFHRLNEEVFDGVIYDFDEASVIYNKAINHLSKYSMDLGFFKLFKPGRTEEIKSKKYPIREEFYLEKLANYCKCLDLEISEELMDDNNINLLLLGFNAEIDLEIAYWKKYDED